MGRAESVFLYPGDTLNAQFNQPEVAAMSHLVQEWADDDAPVVDVYERVILMTLARHANDDGTGGYSPVSSMATAAVCDTETVQRCLEAMTTRGLIALDDRQLDKSDTPLPNDLLAVSEDRQVYEVLVPCAWYSPQQLIEINRGRAETGLAPITPDNRPSIAGEVSS